MSFKYILDKKINLSVIYAKEDVANGDILELIDNITTNKLIKTETGDLTEKVPDQVVIKKINKVTT